MKYSIRDLLLLTVIVALATGWWVDRWQLLAETAKRKASEDQFRQEAAKVMAENDSLKRLFFSSSKKRSPEATNQPAK